MNKVETIFGIPRPWVVVASGALFYCYQFLLRVAPNVMNDDLTLHFAIDAGTFGTMISFYSWSYAGVQLPLGIALDHFGAGRLLVISSLVCALSCFLFASTDSVTIASIALFLMGLGSACGFLGSIKLGTTWLPPAYLAKVVALTLVFGTIGAGLGGPPLRALNELLGWQGSLWLLGWVGVGISGVIFMAVGRHKEPISEGDATNSYEGLLAILKNPQAWLIALYGMLMYAPITVMGTAWGVPFIQNIYPEVDEKWAALVFTIMFIGAAIGSPAFAFISDGMKRRLPPMLFGAIISSIVYLIIVFLPEVPFYMMFGLFFVAGFCYTAKTLSFTAACEIMPKSCSGVAVGFLNTITMATGALFHPLMGKLLHIHWDGTLGDGRPIYSEWDYRFALSIIPICLVLSVILIRFIRETHCANPDSQAYREPEELIASSSTRKK